jgi:hypothetical protein
MAKLTGGGILGNKNVAPPVRTGSPSRGSSPGAADQIERAWPSKEKWSTRAVVTRAAGHTAISSP